MSTLRKPLPTLSQMPWNIKKAIVNSLDCNSQSAVRLCSRELRDHVSKAPIFHKRLFISVGINCIIMEAYPFPVRIGSLYYSPELENKAIRLLSKILDHRDVTIGELQLLNQFTFLTSLVEFLEKRKTLLKVKKLNLTADMIRFGPLIHRLISCLEPGVLESINLKNQQLMPSSLINWEAISNTMQWKQAKQVFTTGCSMSLPYKEWSHLECPLLRVDDLPVEAVKGIMENIYRNPKWEQMNIEHNGRHSKDISAYFEQLGMNLDDSFMDLPNPFNEQDVFTILAVGNVVSVLRKP